MTYPVVLMVNCTAAYLQFILKYGWTISYSAKTPSSVQSYREYARCPSRKYHESTRRGIVSGKMVASVSFKIASPVSGLEYITKTTYGRLTLRTGNSSLASSTRVLNTVLGKPVQRTPCGFEI